MTHCNRCESDTICTGCVDTYYPKGSVCEACTDFGEYCMLCSTDQCIHCFDGYYLEGGNCYSCQANNPDCVECSSRTICTKCVSAKYPEPDGQCQGCSTYGDAQCAQCSAKFSCTFCKTNDYYPEAISPGITQCVLCDTLNQGCSTCKKLVQTNEF